MLEEFSYLGSEKAEEVVITNTNKIADMIEKISPIHPDKFPPVIPNSDQDLRDICFKKAHEIYGEKLPGIVEAVSYTHLEDPDNYCKYHSSVEKPDGAGSWNRSFYPGGAGSETGI